MAYLSCLGQLDDWLESAQLLSYVYGKCRHVLNKAENRLNGYNRVTLPRRP